MNNCFKVGFVFCDSMKYKFCVRYKIGFFFDLVSGSDVVYVWCLIGE